jgi:predicted enzyme related to lactoylglutathione lyase
MIISTEIPGRDRRDRIALPIFSGRMRLQRAVPILTVEDLPKAVAQYRDLFGFDVLMDLGWIVTLGNAGSAPQFSLMESDQTAPVNPVASLHVADVDEAYERARALGLEIVHPLSDEPWGVRRFFFSDIAGNVVNVLSHS